MDIIVWIIIGAISAILLTFVIYYLIKIFKMSPDERKQLLITFLIGLVNIAEAEFVGSYLGKEKLAWVEEQFNKTAPWFLKLVLKFTKTTNLHELIELALQKAKSIEWDKHTFISIKELD